MPGSYTKFEKFKWISSYLKTRNCCSNSAPCSVLARCHISPITIILHVVAVGEKFLKLVWSKYFSPWIKNWKAHTPKYSTSTYPPCVPQDPLSGFKLSSNVKNLCVQILVHYVALANCLALLFFSSFLP